jgi:hypothetical protein
MKRLLATATACVALAGCSAADDTSTSTTGAQSEATTTKSKRASSSDGGFRRWVRENLPDTSADTLVRSAFIGGFTPTLYAKVPPSTTDEKAKNICAAILSWLDDVGLEDAEQGQVESSPGGAIAKCRIGQPTEIVR